MANIPTIQQIENMIEKAKNGDTEAFKELGELNNKLSKRANQRMSEIERSKDIAHTDAYDRAQNYLENVSDISNRNKSGNMRFSQSRNLSLDDMAENLDNVSQFLRNETSKVSKERFRRAEESFETLTSKGFIDDLSQTEKRKFFKFLSTDAWAEIKKHLGSGFLKDAADAISAGVRVGDLKNLYNDYKSRTDVDIFDVTDTWVSGKRKL